VGLAVELGAVGLGEGAAVPFRVGVALGAGETGGAGGAAVTVAVCFGPTRIVRAACPALPAASVAVAVNV
jgi:hypothetical protein